MTVMTVVDILVRAVVIVLPVFVWWELRRQARHIGTIHQLVNSQHQTMVTELATANLRIESLLAEIRGLRA